MYPLALMNRGRKENLERHLECDCPRPVEAIGVNDGIRRQQVKVAARLFKANEKVTLVADTGTHESIPVALKRRAA